jgi:hypothetical protein
MIAWKRAAGPNAQIAISFTFLVVILELGSDIK